MTALDLPIDPSTPPRAARAALSHIIDYAGSFPPASLPVLEALRRYADYAASPWSWMLGRFVCSTAHLAEVSDHLPSLLAPLRFAILPSGGPSEERFLSALAVDCGAAARFQREHGTTVRLEQAEARLPASIHDPEAAERFVRHVRRALDTAGFRDLDFFFEISLDEHLEGTLPGLVRACSDAGSTDCGETSSAARGEASSDEGRGRFGIKIRTGGTAAADTPAVEHVARVIVACRDAAVPFKATAGLHHPLRRVDPATGTPHHGFLNVFLGSILAAAHDLDETAVAAIVGDDDARHFVLDETRAAWTHLSADVPRIESARCTLATSFGSCNFTEPVNDLRSLGFL